MICALIFNTHGSSNRAIPAALLCLGPRVLPAVVAPQIGPLHVVEEIDARTVVVLTNQAIPLVSQALRIALLRQCHQLVAIRQGET